MDRLACVDLAAFPLQLLCRRNPKWAEHPVAVISEDKPQGTLLWVNEPARQAHILPGQRYAHALSLATDLRAGEVSATEIERGIAEVADILHNFSPDIDPCSGAPGVFWLNAAGLGKLYRSLPRWGQAIRAKLGKHGFTATVVVGFSRFATYASARTQRGGVTSFDDVASEREATRCVALDRLDLEPALREALAKLGVVTLGAFLRLPPGGLLERFGNEAYRLHRLAAGERWDPLQPTFAPESPERRLLLDDPETNSERLLFTIKRGLGPLLDQLAASKTALATLFIEFTLYRSKEPRLDAIRPAEPTLDARTLLRLVHLRLESSPLSAGVVELLLSAEDVPATREQLNLFKQRPRRDLRAANQAFARIRAELGNQAIVKATIRDGHLPEARYGWSVIDRATLPDRDRVARKASELRPLVRRIRNRPLLLPAQSVNTRDDGWLLRGLEHGPVVQVRGPYIISGGWWQSEVHREYHFAETRRGACMWVYYDRRRRRWFLHGQVE